MAYFKKAKEVMMKKVEHAWGRSDRNQVVLMNEQRGWRLVEETDNGGLRPHYELTFEKASVMGGKSKSGGLLIDK
mgnify:CR=1 FL=1